MTQAWIDRILSGGLDARLRELYGSERVAAQRERYARAVASYREVFGEPDNLWLFSAPGRTEIGGNHTDHNHGRVLAGAVDLDILAVVSRTGADSPARVQSQGYRMDTVEPGEVEARQEEKNRAISLLRGTVAGFVRRGHRVGGFNAYTTSDVLKGSGLSSSAAYEVALGAILNRLYNGGGVSAVEIAQIAQYAENEYYGKPSGLMDQMASSVGGVIAIDFEDPARPHIRPVAADFEHSGYALCIVDAGGSHADLTHEYAAVPQEMLAVARSLGADTLRGTSSAAVLREIGPLRAAHGDRAVLRALHFFAENERVDGEVAALERGDFPAFLQLVAASGHSSFEYLQNVYPTVDVRHQGLSLALCLAQGLLGSRGAWRVHGGGFGGTTQNFVPRDLVEPFRERMEAVFGPGSCHILRLRAAGGVCVAAPEDAGAE